MFTVNDLGLTPALMRCLATTNIVENPNGTSDDHAPCKPLARSRRDDPAQVFILGGYGWGWRNDTNARRPYIR